MRAIHRTCRSACARRRECRLPASLTSKTFEFSRVGKDAGRRGRHLAFVQRCGSNPVGSPAFPVLVGKAARRSRTGDLLKVTLPSPRSPTIIIWNLTGSCPGLNMARGFVLSAEFGSPPLPFQLTSGIISVCLDLAGRFRNKDIHLC